MSSEKKRVREEFRRSVFERDNHRCCICKRDSGFTIFEDKLDAHHITDRKIMPNGGYVPQNGICLCSECHEKAERYHATGGTQVFPGFSPVELYKAIGSSYDEAFEASEGLKK